MHIAIYMHILEQKGQDKNLACIPLSTLSKNDRSRGFQTAEAARD